MTNRYEDAMNALTRLEDILGETFIGSEFGTIRHALQLAQETEQLRLKLSETAIHLAARNSEIEQLRKETERLVRENEVFAERHKAWESCVYAVGLPVIRDVRDTEYGDAVPPVPVVNKVTDLLDECNKLRKERDELAAALDDILHSAFEHRCKNLSGKTLDLDGEMLWKAKQLVNKIRSK